VLPDVEARCRRAAGAAFAAAWPDPPPAEASLMLTDDAGLRALNRAHRGRDAATNVLSFPLLALVVGEVPPPPPPAGPPLHLGDVAIAYETVRDEAAEQGKPLADHLSHLVVHGMLHLMGYDHGTAADATMMETLETEVLATLGVADPYADHDR
jgi:probable rRNA maturation factor